MGVTLSQDGANLVRVAFSGKDWDTIVAELQQFIKDAFGEELYNNFIADDAGQMFFETTAYGLMSAFWFMDRQAGEDTLETAELPSSVARLARLVGYRSSGVVPATGNVQVTLVQPKTFPVPIAQGSQLVATNGAIYETSQAALFNTGEVGPKTIPVVEGETIEEVFTSDGTASQIFRLRSIPSNKAISQGSATAKVNGVIWPAQKFLQFAATNQVEFAYAEAPPFARFGEGIAGNIPPNGAEIRITYRATLGVNGAAPSNTINAFRQPVSASNQNVALVVTNTTATSPGSDADSIVKTKTLAPQVFAAADRAVNEQDYQALIQSFVDPDFGAVAVGQAVIARSFDEDTETRTIIELVEAQTGALPADLKTRLRTHWGNTLASNCKANLVSVQILQRDSDSVLVAPNAGLAGALKSFLSTRKEASATLSVVDGSINLFRVFTTVNVSVDPTFNRSAVLAAVETAVDAYLKSKTFGDAVRIGDLYAIVEAVDGVDYSNIQFTQVLNNLSVAVDKLDVFGNVDVETFEVLTAGTTTVVPITT